MGTPANCPHGNPIITTDGPYYRQVHPNNFQNGKALPGSFVLGDTGCHRTLSLNDGVRTTPERCYREYIQNSGKESAAVLQVSREELSTNGAYSIVDSPNGTTYAHVDAMYDRGLSNKARKNVDKALMTAANKRGPAYIP